MARIGLGDTMLSGITKMAESNPGAVSVMVAILDRGEAIDPLSAMGAFGAVLSLDTHGIYGSRIWLLFKDVCRENLTHALGLLRAVQLGILAEAELHAALRWAERPEGACPLDPKALTAKVRERLGRGFEEPADAAA